MEKYVYLKTDFIYLEIQINPLYLIHFCFCCCCSFSITWEIFIISIISKKLSQKQKEMRKNSVLIIHKHYLKLVLSIPSLSLVWNKASLFYAPKKDTYSEKCLKFNWKTAGIHNMLQQSSLSGVDMNLTGILTLFTSRTVVDWVKEVLRDWGYNACSLDVWILWFLNLTDFWDLN